MTRISDISLQTSGSTLLLIAALVLGVAFSYFVYRRTIPPVSTFWRVLLMSLRAVAVILIILLLFKPILSVTRQKQEKPVVAVMVDNSASMSLVDQKMDRSLELKNVLDSSFFQKGSDEYDLRFYRFSNRLGDEFQPVSDSLAFTGDGTDIQTALSQLKEELSEKYFSAAVLITDGAANLGENPARYAEKYGLPIYPVAIGDPAEQKDILITNFVTNEIAYAGSETPVDVYVKNSGFGDQKVSIRLNSQGKTLETKTVTLSDKGFEQKIRFNFKPEKAGLTKYELKLSQLEGELTYINNSKPFYVKVLKSKLKVLLVTGGPSADLRFLQNVLETDENIDLQTAVEKSRGQFYPGKDLPQNLSEFDCIILLDYPRSLSKPQSMERIKQALARGKPLLLLWGKNVDLAKLWVLQDFVPLQQQPVRGSERLAYIRVLPTALTNPLMRLSEDDVDNREKWRELPPVFQNVRSIGLKGSAYLLASADNGRTGSGADQSQPLIITSGSGKRKSAVVLAYGLWRWDLLMWGAGKTNESYLRFLQNALRWLTTEDDSKLVRITSNKEIYRSGEQITFTAQVYFEDYQPAEGAEVVVQVKTGDETQEITLDDIGGGRYEGSLQALKGGDYQFTGTAHDQARILGRDSGRFSVEKFSLEYQNTRMNEPLLQKIAANSGGEFYTHENFDGLNEKLQFPEKYITLENEWEIWNRLPMLLTCILLLSTEWFIRKRKGMV